MPRYRVTFDIELDDEVLLIDNYRKWLEVMDPNYLGSHNGIGRLLSVEQYIPPSKEGTWDSLLKTPDGR